MMKAHKKKGKIIKAVKHMLILKKGVDAAGPTENTQLREQDDASLIARARAVMKDKKRYAGAKRGAKRLLKESRQSAEDMEEQVEELEVLSLEKARKMPVGTISHGRKKVAEGKWVDVPKGKGASLEQKVTQAKALGKKAFLAGKKLIPAHDSALMKLLEGFPIGGGGKEIMEAWSKEWHKLNANKSLEDIEPGLKLYNVELLKPSKFRKAIRGDSMMVFGKAKGKKAGVGTVSVHGGKKMVKTNQGWEPVSAIGKRREYQNRTYVLQQSGRWKDVTDEEEDELFEEVRTRGRDTASSLPVKKSRGKKATVGTRATHGGKKMVKTADGWKPVKSGERGTPDQDTKGPKGRGAGPGGGKADGSGKKKGEGDDTEAVAEAERVAQIIFDAVKHYYESIL